MRCDNLDKQSVLFTSLLYSGFGCKKVMFGFGDGNNLLIEVIVTTEKPYLEKNYKCYNSVADLYTYFIEKGIKLMR